MARLQIPILVAAFCLIPGCAFVARAQTGEPQERGELLYSTYCSACHRTEIHWREKRLATDWNSLTAQVRRWQTNSGLNWDEGDTTAIARYLNAKYYRFPEEGGVR